LHRKRNLIACLVILLLVFSGCTVPNNKHEEESGNSAVKENTVDEQYNAVVFSDGVDETCTENTSDESDSEPQSVPVPNSDSDSDFFVPKLAPGKYTVSQTSEIFYTDRAIIYIEPNIYYPKDFGDIVEYTLDLIEQETGLTFSTDKQLIIQVQQKAGPYGTKSGIVIQPVDVLPDNIYTLFHELSHTVQYQTCDITMLSITEGFAIMNSMKMSGKSRLPSLYDVFFNMSFFDNESLMLSDPETYLTEVRGWDAYMAGFRFVYFLEEKYGDDILPKIFRKAGELYPDGGCGNSELIDIIKSQTSQYVFQEFAKWYENNRQIFVRTYPVINLENTDCLEIFPYYDDNTKIYWLPAFTYRNSITLDFTGGFSYLQHSGLKVKGILGTATSEGKHTLSFFDASDKLICTKQIDNSQVELDIYGAVKIEITGDGSVINIQPDINSITVN